MFTLIIFFGIFLMFVVLLTLIIKKFKIGLTKTKPSRYKLAAI